MLRLERALRGVEELRRAALAAEQEFGPDLEAVAPSLRESAYNLVHYLAVRRHDVRQLQDDLMRLGLSSLGRMEAHVMASLQAVFEALSALRGQPVTLDLADEPARSPSIPATCCWPSTPTPFSARRRRGARRASRSRCRAPLPATRG